MKKLVLGLAAVAVIAMVSAPAIAATQWNFGGMIRYATFWDQSQGGKGFRTGDLQAGGADVKNDGALAWGTQGNTRLMMWMKSDHLEGFIELGYFFEGNSVTTREYWGKYKVNDTLSITIGQQHQLYNMFTSRQAGLVDLNLNGVGTAFRPPTPMIMINWGPNNGFLPGAPAGFSVALVKPETEIGYTKYAGPGNISNINYVLRSYDEDTIIPQIQAAYQYYGDTYRFKVAGAYQWTKIKDITPVIDTMDISRSENIHSWLVSADADISFGPLWLAAGAAVGQNWGNAGWMNSEFGSVHKDGFPVYASLHEIASARYKTKGVSADAAAKLESTTSWMVHAVAAYQLTEALRFEAGAGFRYDDNDTYDKASKILAAYVQAAYTIAPGFEIVPEIGYIDRGKDVYGRGDKGYIWYAGAQWNMYF